MSDTAIVRTPPRRIERKLTTLGDDDWYEYQGEQLFDDGTIERLARRFREMERAEWDKPFGVKGSSGSKTKIRTKDIDGFREAIADAESDWVADHGPHLVTIGNARYGEPVGDCGVVVIYDENPRKTVVRSQYQTGRRAFLGGGKGKRQDILLGIRAFEQWAYHTEVVEPVFDRFNEKYPY